MVCCSFELQFMENLKDTYRARGLRKQLVEEVVKKGIKDERVIMAIGKIPRHFFLDNIFLTHAYEDKAFPIGEGQTISQPYTVAFQSEQLAIQPGDKVLEVGTGSGYQACVLMELGAEVFTIEYNTKLYKKTSKFLPKIGYKPHFFQGDGSQGLPIHAPYDKIIVTAGAPTVPASLIKQLNPNGILIIPVGNDKRQKMLKIKKTKENKLIKKEFNYFSFVPLLGKEGWNK
jgi:protein-L-isoaspartate(D-aspartate) O-methyltransferase